MYSGIMWEITDLDGKPKDVFLWDQEIIFDIDELIPDRMARLFYENGTRLRLTSPVNNINIGDDCIAFTTLNSIYIIKEIRLIGQD
jgi:hypothetical protein